MGLPYRRYGVWYLLTHSADELKKHLDDLSLPLPGSAALSQIESEASGLMLPPRVRTLLAREKRLWDESSSTYLHKLGYGELYDWELKRPGLDHHMVSAWEACWKILHNPVARVAIESALLAKVPLPELAGSAAEMAGTQLTELTLELYCRQFFDHQAMAKSDWREYLKTSCASHAYVYLRYQTALLRSKEETLYLVGLPTRTQLGQFLNQVLNTANFKFQRYAAHNSPESEKQARAWAKLGIEAGIRAEKFAASDITDFAKAIQAEFEYVESPMETITGEMLAEVAPPDAEKATQKAPDLPQPTSVDPENY
jgi:hypothetical protein